MKFSKEFLKEGLHDSRNTVLTEITDATRWSVVYWRVFVHEGKFYGTYYSRGATESQDESPYEYDDEEIECPELVATQKTITVYVPKETK